MRLKRPEFPLFGWLPLVLALVLVLGSCGVAGPTVPANYDASCEGLNPLYCLLPWPSDRWLEEDPSTETGYRLRYESAAIPLNKDGADFD
ncbi:MAG: hypothetical protein VX498_08710, partial [Myxococcota bacterium]|nr:hypothetical protein [Myxococcota bacterium]